MQYDTEIQFYDHQVKRKWFDKTIRLQTYLILSFRIILFVQHFEQDVYDITKHVNNAKEKAKLTKKELQK